MSSCIILSEKTQTAMGKEERRKTEIEGLFCIQRVGCVDLGRYSNKAKGYESARANGTAKLRSAMIIGMDMNPLPHAVRNLVGRDARLGLNRHRVKRR
jgi:hypothetical protein